MEKPVFVGVQYQIREESVSTLALGHQSEMSLIHLGTSLKQGNEESRFNNNQTLNKVVEDENEIKLHQTNATLTNRRAAMFSTGAMEGGQTA
jgi:hypothetical protein